jgi:glycosyltransferase involved in cell wall biosynthesis
MHCVVISHKECWRGDGDDFVTIGGFPLQIQALSELFQRTTLLLPVFKGPPPPGALRLEGRNLRITVVAAPTGRDLRRKIALLMWLPRHFGTLWRVIASADVVHALVPGDVGSVGVALALLQRKRLFVRHCGTWAHPVTIADRLLHWLLLRIASHTTPVFATGGARERPASTNSSIQWIFSSTLSAQDLAGGRRGRRWAPESPLRLVTVCRLVPDKNVGSSIRALPALLNAGLDVTLDIAGEGRDAPTLQGIVDELGLADRVVFHGNINHAAVLDLLRRSDLFVFPTRLREGFPKAVIEAMACGVPVIATPVSVIPMLLGDGAGVTLSDSSPEAIAGAVRLVVADPQEMAAMSRRASVAASRFTLDAWKIQIGMRLSEAWGVLRQGQPLEAVPSDCA